MGKRVWEAAISEKGSPGGVVTRATMPEQSRAMSTPRSAVTALIFEIRSPSFASRTVAPSPTGPAPRRFAPHGFRL